jgi:hypothetical protein
MKLLRVMLVSAALVLSTAATAQVWLGQYQDRDYDRDRMQNSAAFQQGMREGMDDARRGRQAVTRPDRWGNDWDRRAYQTGYLQGYNNVRQNGGYYGRDRDRDWDRDRGYANGGYYGNNGYYNNGYGNGMQVAQRFGYQDGLRDGANDRQTGHSFRPTQDDSFRSATNGYQGVFGSRDQYKQWYRQAYEQGYQQGYNGNNRGYGYRWFPR